MVFKRDFDNIFSFLRPLRKKKEQKKDNDEEDNPEDKTHDKNVTEPDAATMPAIPSDTIPKPRTNRFEVK